MKIVIDQGQCRAAYDSLEKIVIHDEILRIVEHHIEPRDFTIRPLSEHGFSEDAAALIPFIATGNANSIPARYFLTVDTDTMASTTRNLVLHDSELDEDTVINGFGWQENEITQNPPCIKCTIQKPNGRIKFTDFVKKTMGTSAGVPGTTLVDHLGELYQEPANDPLGGFTREGVIEKIEGSSLAESIFSSINQFVAFPQFLGAFEYEGEEVYGFIYRRPRFRSPFNICDRGNHEIISNYISQEYSFMMGLLQKGLIHYQLHGGNKGLTMNGRFYIGDLESLKSLTGYSKTAFMAAFGQSLGVAIGGDIGLLGEKMPERGLLKVETLKTAVFGNLLDMILGVLIKDATQRHNAKVHVTRQLPVGLERAILTSQKQGEKLIASDINRTILNAVGVVIADYFFKDNPNIVDSVIANEV